MIFKILGNINSCFAMISSEAKVAEAVTIGVYHFKIHDVFYHRSGPMTAAYGCSPFYVQLYIYDVDTAINYRLQERINQTCNNNIMREISLELERSNPFDRSFIAMKDHCQRVENQNKEICMLIKLNHHLDLCRFNDAIQTDVGVIFRTYLFDGKPPFEHNMICFLKVNGIIKNISVLDSSLDPLAYPLLFPNGDTGWHVNIAHNTPTTSNSRAPRNKLTMLQYTAYRLAIRDDFSMLHHSQKLFLQWIVDMYVRIEGSRSHFIRQNQTSLRSEVYNNLTDYLELNMNARNVGRRVILPSSFNGSPRNMYQNYLDAMSIVQHYGNTFLFITMTCNPRWLEIVNSIGVGEAPNFRPDITVFKV